MNWIEDYAGDLINLDLVNNIVLYDPYDFDDHRNCYILIAHLTSGKKIEVLSSSEIDVCSIVFDRIKNLLNPKSLRED